MTDPDRRHLRVVSSQPGLDRADTRTLVCHLLAQHGYQLDDVDVIGIVDIAEDHPEAAIAQAFTTWAERNDLIPPTVIGINQLLNPIDVSTIVREIKRTIHTTTSPTEEP